MRGYDPLAPRRPKTVRRDVRRGVSAMILPLLTQLNREFAGKSREASGLTDVLAQHLAGLQGKTHDIYAGAQQSQSALDTALANRLTGAGASLNAEQNKALALAGQAPTQGAAQLGAGAANAGFGIGSASLARLIAQGAAAENYAGTLPGIARLGGQQHLRQIEGERSLAAGQLRSKMPGLIEQIYQDEMNREFQKAAAGLSYSGTLAGIQGQNQRTLLQQQGATGRTRIQQQHADDRTRANIEGTAARQGRAYDENLSRSAGHAVDHQGRPIKNPKTGRPYRYVPKKKGGKKNTGPFGGP